MSDSIVLVEQASDWKPDDPDLPVMTARDYLTDPANARRRGLRVVNFCRSYRYLSVGYYCSLLAEARGHKTIPSPRTMQDLAGGAMFGLVSGELAEEIEPGLQRWMKGRAEARHELLVCFGESLDPDFAALGRLVFERFPCPVLSVSLRRNDTWQIHAVRPAALTRLDERARAACIEALRRYLGRRWSSRPRSVRYRYDLAILHDPGEALPPSNPRALRRFEKAGRALGLDTEMITRRDLGRLPEFDALFIRETTQVTHHTYRFARKAQAEDMIVIDDPDSILRCTNKVYLAELLASRRVPTPATVVLRRDNLLSVEDRMAYPIVLKIPDGSFSRGVVKAESREELEAHGAALLEDSELILAQEFMYTPYDWRIGVLDRKPLYACRYFMSGEHWQIYDHRRRDAAASGDSETLALEAVPGSVVATAVRAANLIGDGLYGVDLKQLGERVVVVEVNDNPSIDAGYEDAVLDDALYEAIMRSFLVRLDAQMGIGARS